MGDSGLLLEGDINSPTPQVLNANNTNLNTDTDNVTLNTQHYQQIRKNYHSRPFTNLSNILLANQSNKLQQSRSRSNVNIKIVNNSIANIGPADYENFNTKCVINGDHYNNEMPTTKVIKVRQIGRSVFDNQRVSNCDQTNLNKNKYSLNTNIYSNSHHQMAERLENSQKENVFQDFTQHSNSSNSTSYNPFADENERFQTFQLSKSIYNDGQQHSFAGNNYQDIQPMNSYNQNSVPCMPLRQNQAVYFNENSVNSYHSNYNENQINVGMDLNSYNCDSSSSTSTFDMVTQKMNTIQCDSSATNSNHMHENNQHSLKPYDLESDIWMNFNN